MISFEVISKAFNVFRNESAKKADKRAKFKIAKAFNKFYTHMYRPSVNNGRGQWMCPSCNKIHDQVSFSVFSGRTFPACCEFDAGHRCFKFHAAP